MWQTYIRKITVKFPSAEFERLQSALTHSTYRGRPSFSAFIRRAVRETLDRIGAEEQARPEKSDNELGRVNGRTRRAPQPSAIRRRKSGTR